MDRDDLELFERSLRQATEVHTGDALDRALVDLGWPDALADEPQAAVSMLFALQGEANATSSALDHVLAHGLGVGAGAPPAVLLPALGSVVPPGRLDDGGRTVVDGLGTASVGHADAVLVVARNGDKDVAVLASESDLTRRTVGGVDPWLGLVQVSGETDAAAASPVTAWGGAVALGQLALGHELVGAARRMLALAREHALDRVQFGKPIGSFQAVRHRLAETLVAIETAEAMLAAAWEDESPGSAAMAKALAGRGARTASKHCQQVLAGIGFTVEHPLQRYVRRVLVLDELLGSARSLTRALGSDVIASKALPAMLPL